MLPFGRFHYNVAPQGANLSSDVFNNATDLPIEDLHWIIKLVDDMLIWAPTKAILFKRIRTFLNRMRADNIKLSRKKFQIGQDLKFVGYQVSAEGIRPDPAKVAGISNFASPKSTTELKSFLGLAQQLGFFLPDLSHATSSMRELLKKNVAWLWTPEHEEEFQKAKQILTSPALVKPFDPSLKTVLLTDASRLHGMGYALCQEEGMINGQPKLRLIACNSRSFTPTQQRYATVELECLAIKWAVEDLLFYLQGMPEITVVTDHNPLLGVFKKHLYEIDNTRLLKYREVLMGHGLHLNLKWVAGKDHLIADALSRAPVFQGLDDDEDPVTVSVNQAIATDPVFNILFDHCDDDTHKLATSIEAGHEPQKGQFYSNWNQLSVLRRKTDDVPLLVVDGKKLFVPPGARPELLRRLHRAHAGETKTLRTARASYFWPNMANEIRQMVRTCSACQKLRPSQSDEPSIVSPMAATRPMEALGMDLFHEGGEHLLIVDRYSGYLWHRDLKSVSAQSVVNKLKAIIVEFGFPTSIRTDGGPQFQGSFVTFLNELGIVHEVSSPHNPQSNGLAESGVKQVKFLLKKCNDTKEDFPLALLAYNATARADGFSPAEAFFGRQINAGWPFIESSFDPEKFFQTREKTRSRALENMGGQKLSDLEIGEDVAIQDTHTKLWDRHGTIEQIHPCGKSFIVDLFDGGKLRRNRRYLKPIWESFPLKDAEVSLPEKNNEDNALRRSARLAEKHVTK